MHELERSELCTIAQLRRARRFQRTGNNNARISKRIVRHHWNCSTRGRNGVTLSRQLLWLLSHELGFSVHAVLG